MGVSEVTIKLVKPGSTENEIYVDGKKIKMAISKIEIDLPAADIPKVIFTVLAEKISLEDLRYTSKK